MVVANAAFRAWRIILREQLGSASSYFTSRLANGLFNPPGCGSVETGTLSFAGRTAEFVPVIEPKGAGYPCAQSNLASTNATRHFATAACFAKA
jgi:hypothetical protein